MSNPLFQALGGNRNNALAQFQTFMEQMQGKNPYEEIEKLLRSGKISQRQLDQAQQMAQQFARMLNR